MEEVAVIKQDQEERIEDEMLFHWKKAYEHTAMTFWPFIQKFYEHSELLPHHTLLGSFPDTDIVKINGSSTINQTIPLNTQQKLALPLPMNSTLQRGNNTSFIQRKNHNNSLDLGPTITNMIQIAYLFFHWFYYYTMYNNYVSSIHHMWIIVDVL